MNWLDGCIPFDVVITFCQSHPFVSLLRLSPKANNNINFDLNFVCRNCIFKWFITESLATSQIMCDGHFSRFCSRHSEYLLMRGTKGKITIITTVIVAIVWPSIFAWIPRNRLPRKMRSKPSFPFHIHSHDWNVHLYSTSLMTADDLIIVQFGLHIVILWFWNQT